MKKLLIPFLFFCAITIWAQDYFYAYYSDGTIEKFPTENIDSVSVVVPQGTVTDLCGNTYNYKYIGNLLWMTSNLRCDKYMVDDEIRTLEKNKGYRQPSCSWYDDKCKKMTDQLIRDAGYLYYSHPSGLCPDGWRLPTKEDFEDLLDFALDKGASLASSDGWYSSVSADELGFNALPAGVCPYSQYPERMGVYTEFPTATTCTFQDGYQYVQGRYIFCITENNGGFRYDFACYYNNEAKSVRCVRDKIPIGK